MKNPRNFPILVILIMVAGVVLLALLTWGNYQFAKENPGGNDFLVHWAGTRALITEGLNPYNDEMAEKTQNLAYGRIARLGEPQLQAVYPLYAVIVFLPFSLIADFTLARALWMTFLEAGLILLLVFGLRLARWRAGIAMLAILLVFTLLWFHGLRPLMSGNVAILVGLLLFGGVLALRGGADELAGVLFAFSTIKPNVVILALVFVIIWAANKGRWRVVGWMFATVILLSASSALFIPSWILDNLLQVIGFTASNPPGTPRTIFMEWWPAWGSRVGWALTGVIALIVVIEWINNRKADFHGFFWTFCLTLTAGQWSGIHTNPENFIVLLPALLLVFSLFDDRWKTFGRFFVILSLLLLFAGIWAIALNTMDNINQPVQGFALFFPLPAYLLLTLYWVRWWAIRPPSVWYDLLEGR